MAENCEKLEGNSMGSNRKSVLAGVATAALLAAGQTAIAADILPEAEPIADWTGFHIGIGGGYGSVLHEGDAFASFESIVLGADLDDVGDEGGILTVEAGFDLQLSDRFVVGILGDFTWADFESEATSRFAVSQTLIETGIGIGLEDMWTIAGRFGFLSSPDTLWYGLVGWTHADVEFEGEFSKGKIGQEPSFEFSFDDSESVDGLTVGAGVDHMFTDNISGKLEYRYTDLGEISGDETITAQGEDVGEFPFDFGTTVQTIRAVLSIRFGGFGLSQ
jgi:outer membrane immunogenic protein